MNYTKPNDLNHQDTPQDWLNTSLVFARTLSLLLERGKGIIVDVKGDVNLGEGINKVIVFNRNEQIIIEEFNVNLDEGTPMMVIDED
jgi:hypothetical protein